MKNYRKWIGYLVFAMFLSGVCLYLSFPAEVIREYLEGSTSRLAPALGLKVHGVRPVLPFGLKLENADLSLKEMPEFSVFSADSFMVMPSMRSLTLRRPAFRLDCEAYGGNIQGVISLQTFSLKGPVQSEIEIIDVRLDQYPQLEKWLQGELTGTMSGTVVYVCSAGEFIDGSGEGNFSILDSSLQLAQPFLGMESIHFGRIDAQMVMEKQRISLVRFDFSGEEIEGSVSGDINLAPNLANSKLDLTVEVKEFSSMLKNRGDFRISISGTVAQPLVSFI